MKSCLPVSCIRNLCLFIINFSGFLTILCLTRTTLREGLSGPRRGRGYVDNAEGGAKWTTQREGLSGCPSLKFIMYFF